LNDTPRQTRPATLKDIAAAVGVDVSTVSKVVNSGDISVRPETRQAILDAAARLNYRPHALARNLRSTPPRSAVRCGAPTS
jgi:LacI family transcriptional regulator